VLRREPERCLENAESVLGFAEKHGFVVWVAQSHICAGWAEVKLGGGEAGVRRMKRGIDQWTGTGALLHVGTWSSYAADAALSVGDLVVAGEFLREGLQRARRYGEAYTLAELQRLSALVTLGYGDHVGAEAQLRESIGTAVNQGARFFKLRSLRDLVTLRRTCLQDDGRELRELSDLLAQIVEGHNLPDIAEAQALL
jgi:predicted ATPase